jgi:hypothetical protein
MDQENIELKQSPGFSTPKYNKEISNSATATPVKINALKRKSSDNNIVSENENSNVKRIKRQPVVIFFVQKSFFFYFIY